MKTKDAQSLPGLEAPTETLEGFVESIVFESEDTGFVVLRFRRDERGPLQTAVGTLPGVQAGESLRLTGRWAVDPKWGPQFRAESYVPVLPSTVVGIEKYLGSGMIRGVGKEMARRLVERFGARTLEVIEGAPEQLRTVEGVGPKRSRAITEAWNEQREVREIMVFLRGLGISAGHAARIYKRLGRGAVGALREDPYRLAEEISGIGFKTADKIGASLGIAKEAAQRVEAGLRHALREATGEGHLYLPRAELLKRAVELLEVPPDLLERGVDSLAAARTVVVDRDPAGAPCVFTAELHQAEVEVAVRLRQLAAGREPPLVPDGEAALAAYEARSGVKLADLQRAAVLRALTAKVMVVTGGPGTGKTTLVNSLLKVVDGAGRRVAMGAPTGRAAKRLSEAAGREAKTLHRLLEFSPREGRFQRSAESPLQADLVIVDEVSMVDLPLFRSLLQALRPAARLLLVGDVDQLPSVGPGAVLRDVIDSGLLDVVRLDEVFRQAQGSQIVMNAHKVNRGQVPDLDQAPGSSDFYVLTRQEPEQVLDTLKLLVSERIPKRFGLDPRKDVQVLTPMHRGLLGAMNLNVELQQLLNPTGRELRRGGRVFREGDRVMQLSNDYEKDVFNGDVGWVRRVDEEAGAVEVSFDDRAVSYDAADLEDLTLAYACSIHKSQGSEYPVVLLPVHTQHYVMLRRNLLYTGMTRGKKLVVMVGSRKALSIAVSNDRREERYTLLAARLARRLGGGAREGTVTADGC